MPEKKFIVTETHDHKVLICLGDKLVEMTRDQAALLIVDLLISTTGLSRAEVVDSVEGR